MRTDWNNVAATHDEAGTQFAISISPSRSRFDRHLDTVLAVLPHENGPGESLGDACEPPLSLRYTRVKLRSNVLSRYHDATSSSAMPT
jgi:hypothetical protein